MPFDEFIYFRGKYIPSLKVPYKKERSKMAIIIAISNEKGGVAKTTSAISLGASLAETGHRILLIDLDPQANLTLALGYEPGKLESTIGDVILDSGTTIQNPLETSLPNLFLIPANSILEQAEMAITPSKSIRDRLRQAIERSDLIIYDFILIDCPPSLGISTQLALTAANLLIIPTQSEFFSAYALRNMMTLIRDIRVESNPNLAYRILITLYDRRNRAHRDIQTQLETTFGDGLFKTIIEVDTKLRESPILGLPITLYKPTCRGALQYRNLAEELIIFTEKTNSESAK